MKQYLFIASIFFSLTACQEEVKTEAAPAPEQDTAVSTSSNTAAIQSLPNFRVVDASGAVRDLSSIQGKKIFVNLWASWCPPCRHEMPSIEKLYKSVDTSKTVFIMLALDNDFETSKKYVKSKKLDLPVYYPAENLPPLFNVQGIPATFIFNENHELVEAVEGSADYDTEKYRALLK